MNSSPCRAFAYIPDTESFEVGILRRDREENFPCLEELVGTASDCKRPFVRNSEDEVLFTKQTKSAEKTSKSCVVLHWVCFLEENDASTRNAIRSSIMDCEMLLSRQEVQRRPCKLTSRNAGPKTKERRRTGDSSLLNPLSILSRQH